MTKVLRVLVADAQGGGIGKQLITAIRQQLPGLSITAIGANAAATAAMMKAGADQAATGENALVVACRRADVIMGPVGIAIADAMLGEITPKMAAAVGQSEAIRILIPFNQCQTMIAGASGQSGRALIQDAVAMLAALAGQS